MQFLMNRQINPANLSILIFVCFSIGSAVSDAAADGGKCASGDFYPVMRTLGLNTPIKNHKLSLKQIFGSRSEDGKLETSLKVDNVMYVKDSPDQTSLIIRDIILLRNHPKLEEEASEKFVFDERFDTEIFFPSSQVKSGSPKTLKQFPLMIEKLVPSAKIQLTSAVNGDDRFMKIEALWLHYLNKLGKPQQDVFKPLFVKLSRSSESNCYEASGSVDGKDMKKLNFSVLFGSLEETKTLGNVVGAFLKNKELPILRAGTIGNVENGKAFLRETYKYPAEESGVWSSGTRFEYRDFGEPTKK